MWVSQPRFYLYRGYWKLLSIIPSAHPRSLQRTSRKRTANLDPPTRASRTRFRRQVPVYKCRRKRASVLGRRASVRKRADEAPECVTCAVGPYTQPLDIGGRKRCMDTGSRWRKGRQWGRGTGISWIVMASTCNRTKARDRDSSFQSSGGGGWTAGVQCTGGATHPPGADLHGRHGTATECSAEMTG